MINLNELELTWWQKDDIEDLIENHYPDLLEKNITALSALEKSLWCEARRKEDEMLRIGNKAGTIEMLIRKILEKNEKVL